VSHAFNMGDWEPDTVVQVRVNQGTGRATVYAWTIPAQVAGTWMLTTPEGRRLSLQNVLVLGFRAHPNREYKKLNP
jgi:hypothetical protein